MSAEQGDPPADFETALRQFRTEFAQQLPGRLQDARDRLQECLAAPADDGRLRELHHVLHRLAGSAGTFGMPGLGEAARGIEEALDELLLRPGRTAADLAPLAQRIAALAPLAP
jgi:chemotaxis protein histidine kinase CheA